MLGEFLYRQMCFEELKTLLVNKRCINKNSNFTALSQRKLGAGMWSECSIQYKTNLIQQNNSLIEIEYTKEFLENNRDIYEHTRSTYITSPDEVIKRLHETDNEQEVLAPKEFIIDDFFKCIQVIEVEDKNEQQSNFVTELLSDMNIDFCGKFLILLMH